MEGECWNCPAPFPHCMYYMSDDYVSVCLLQCFGFDVAVDAAAQSGSAVAKHHVADTLFNNNILFCYVR